MDGPKEISYSFSGSYHYKMEDFVSNPFCFPQEFLDAAQAAGWTRNEDGIFVLGNNGLRTHPVFFQNIMGFPKETWVQELLDLAYQARHGWTPALP